MKAAHDRKVQKQYPVIDAGSGFVGRDKKITVTGSTGLVGSHLVAELICDGYKNIILPVRSRGSLAKLYKTLEREGADSAGVNLEITETSLGDTQALAEIFRGTDTVFHCAAVISLGGMDESELIRINVDLTRSVVDAAKMAGVRRFMHVSSIASLGDPDPETGVGDEDSVMESADGASGYSASKFLCEQEVGRAAEDGMESVVVNPAPILGLGDGRSGSSVLIPILSHGMPFYTGGCNAFVDVKDVAKALVALSQVGHASGQRFVLAAENRSFRELIAYANAAAGKRPPFIKVGKRMLKAAGRIDAILARLTGRDRLVTDEITHYLTSKSFYNGGKIKKTITFDYIPVRQSVERLVKQYLDEKRR